jgi:hypothetical protein
MAFIVCTLQYFRSEDYVGATNEEGRFHANIAKVVQQLDGVLCRPELGMRHPC